MLRLRSLLGRLFGRWTSPCGVDDASEREELARVRLTAEVAADLLSYGDIALVTNPWPRGTREWVLWETSFQAQMIHNEMDLASDSARGDLRASCERATMGRMLTPRTFVERRPAALYAPNTLASSNGVVTSSWS